MSNQAQIRQTFIIRAPKNCFFCGTDHIHWSKVLKVHFETYHDLCTYPTAIKILRIIFAPCKVAEEASYLLFQHMTNCKEVLRAVDREVISTEVEDGS
jgi:hypothetical protein